MRREIYGNDCALESGSDSLRDHKRHGKGRSTALMAAITVTAQPRLILTDPMHLLAMQSGRVRGFHPLRRMRINADAAAGCGKALRG